MPVHILLTCGLCRENCIYVNFYNIDYQNNAYHSKEEHVKKVSLNIIVFMKRRSIIIILFLEHTPKIQISALYNEI